MRKLRIKNEKFQIIFHVKLELLATLHSFYSTYPIYSFKHFFLLSILCDAMKLVCVRKENFIHENLEKSFTSTNTVTKVIHLLTKRETIPR